MYVQHNGAPPHFSQQVTDYLHDTYPEHWIGKGVQLPGRQNLHVKTLVFGEKTNSGDALICRILDAAEQIRGTDSLMHQSFKCIEIEGT
jgi:hypothetical protein